VDERSAKTVWALRWN